MNRLEKSSFPSWKQLFNYKASYNSTNPKTRTWDILLNGKRHKTKYTVKTKIWFNNYTYMCVCVCVCVCVCLRVTYTLVSSVQSLSRVRLFAAPWTAARQAYLSITNSWSLPKPMSMESVMPSNHFRIIMKLHPQMLILVVSVYGW